MSIKEKVLRLETARQNVISSIRGKGGSVADDAGYNAIPAAIDALPTGGGGLDISAVDWNFGYSTFVSVPDAFLSPVLWRDRTNMGDCFNLCRSLTSLSLPELPNVSAINSCFASCVVLASLSLPALPKVTDMPSCFNCCYKLTSLSLPALPNVTNMYMCFYKCQALTSLTLPELPKVSNVGNMFYDCRLLESLVIGNINPNITTLSNWGLSYCTKLSVDSLVNVLNALPSTTTSKTITIGTTNLAKLTEEQKAIATGKGWTIN